MNKNEDTWYAIVNPDAGSGKTLAEWRKAEPILYTKGIKYRCVMPDSAYSAYMQVKTATERGFRKFLAVGGDGTVHQLVQSIMKVINLSEGSLKLNDFTVAVLPIGSGNDWIKSHNIPKDHSAIIDLMAKESYMYQDVVKADILRSDDRQTIVKTAYMINIGGYAFDANVCDVVNFQKANGIRDKLIYVNALKKLAFKHKAQKASIILDGKEVYNDFVFSISFGNGVYSGGGLAQTPSAVMNDGILNLMVVPKISALTIFLNIKKLITKKIEKVSFLHFFTAKDVIVYPENMGELVEMDGDIIGRAPLHLSFLPEQLRVLHNFKPGEQDGASPSLSLQD